MIMIRPKNKSFKVAEAVLKGKSVKLANPKKNDKKKLDGPYLLH
jgi:hypothetical protein